MSIVPTDINNYLRQFAYQLEERILQQRRACRRRDGMGIFNSVVTGFRPKFACSSFASAV